MRGLESREWSTTHSLCSAATTMIRSLACLLLVPICFLALLSHYPSSSVVQAWGADGHHIICNIAEQMLNPIALAAVEELLPDAVDGNLSDLCSWADDIRHEKGYGWSAALHYIDTPDKLCNYNPIRDCRNAAGTPNFCASGAINNYTEQLHIGTDKYNLTEALLFLAHIIGDIHQPLHVGFEGDSGGNSIEVYWYKKRTNLHHVWDTNIVIEDEDQFFNNDVSALTKSIYDNITSVWSKESAHWRKCAGSETVCPDVYASESIKSACEWAYSDTRTDATLDDNYFLTRVPVLQKRIAQAGVRLAGVLNRLFPDDML